MNDIPEGAEISKHVKNRKKEPSQVSPWRRKRGIPRCVKEGVRASSKTGIRSQFWKKRLALQRGGRLGQGAQIGKKRLQVGGPEEENLSNGAVCDLRARPILQMHPGGRAFWKGSRVDE